MVATKLPFCQARAVLAHWSRLTVAAAVAVPAPNASRSPNSPAERAVQPSGPGRCRPSRSCAARAPGRPLFTGRAGGHPRARIFNVMSLLLWEPATLRSPDLLTLVQSELQTPATTLPALMSAYQALWARVN